MAMSVNIVSTPSVNTAPAVPDAAARDVASGDDFASVLQGQLGLGTAASPAAVGPVLALPAASAASDEDGDTDGAFDPTSLLATMALVAPPVNVDGPTPALTPSADGGDASLATLADTRTGTRAGMVESLGAGAPAAGTAAAASAAAADAQPGTGLPSVALPPAATGDTPAKFAVAAAPVADATATGQAAPESTLNEAALPSENAHAAGHVATGRHVHTETTLAVNTPVRNADWAGDFGQKIVWLATAETQSAQLTLNPPQMGPIEISLSVDRGQASVSFASANAEVRDAIETALPRLREMLASAGIELGQTNVGAESFRQQQQAAWSSSAASRSIDDSAILAADSAAPLPSRAFATQRGNGLVDLFA
jgi:flagellar hook-length control protein FliK